MGIQVDVIKVLSRGLAAHIPAGDSSFGSAGRAACTLTTTVKRGGTRGEGWGEGRRVQLSHHVYNPAFCPHYLQLPSSTPSPAATQIRNFPKSVPAENDLGSAVVEATTVQSQDIVVLLLACSDAAV